MAPNPREVLRQITNPQFDEGRREAIKSTLPIAGGLVAAACGAAPRPPENPTVTPIPPEPSPSSTSPVSPEVEAVQRNEKFAEFRVGLNPMRERAWRDSWEKPAPSFLIVEDKIFFHDAEKDRLVGLTFEELQRSQASYKGIKLDEIKGFPVLAYRDVVLALRDDGRLFEVPLDGKEKKLVAYRQRNPYVWPFYYLSGENGEFLITNTSQGAGVYDPETGEFLYTEN